MKTIENKTLLEPAPVLKGGPLELIPEVNPEGVVQLPPDAKELGQLESVAWDDPNELLEHRYLCRGGGMLLVGPTGIGKSSFVMQCAVLWANGEPAFGIRPNMPLRILMIQAENDDGDLAEMRDGVLAGLNLSASDSLYARENILVFTENSRTSQAFASYTLMPLLEKHRPDLVIIDPALAYLGGDVNAQKDVGAFLRNQLNPLLTEYRCGCIIVHHISKPSREKSPWAGGDFAYLGSGSAEWANWARAVLAICSTKTQSVFELKAPKRGSRLGWEDENANKAFSKFIAHARESGKIYWRDADPSEVSQGDQRQDPQAVICSLLQASDVMPKKHLLEMAQLEGLAVNKAREALGNLVTSGALFEHKKSRSGNRPEVFVSKLKELPAGFWQRFPNGSYNAV